MKYKQLIIEKKEYVLLKQMLSLSNYYQDVIFKKSIKQLMDELETAIISNETDLPDDVVRFNSIVRVSLEGGWTKEFQLVVANKADLKNNKLSVLSPMGTAVMGHALGDVFYWELPSGKKEITVTYVAQQELSNINS
ncbi:GreA/GreB family elongation factor [Joostella atrarenae]|uniref:GreA/GreB family elongation factor n=1 Tax=Joostella atrarenae TaxID=679257 RepID=A0ABS9J5W5_9FLAO|nr:GreA/GreB family elongation factor [Joostella atrarenae]MCF8715723.1 GreA/GreB family elongation factor [Joostella atrarenae]